MKPKLEATTRLRVHAYSAGCSMRASRSVVKNTALGKLSPERPQDSDLS
jgi:hypothetical protein